MTDLDVLTIAEALDLFEWCEYEGIRCVDERRSARNVAAALASRNAEIESWKIMAHRVNERLDGALAEIARLRAVVDAARRQRACDSPGCDKSQFWAAVADLYAALDALDAKGGGVTVTDLPCGCRKYSGDLARKYRDRLCSYHRGYAEGWEEAVEKCAEAALAGGTTEDIAARVRAVLIVERSEQGTR